MAKNIEDFEEFLFPLAPDAPSTIIQHALRESITNFMQITQIATDFFQTALEYNNPDYMVEAPECREVLEIVSVKVGPSGSVPDDRWDELEVGTDYRSDILNDGVPSVILADPPKNNCDKASGSDISIEYSWSMSRDGCELPDFIYQRFMKVIVDGALAILYAIPDQTFTSLPYSMILRDKVDAELKRIKIKYRRRHPQPMKIRRMSVRSGGLAKFWRA